MIRLRSLNLNLPHISGVNGFPLIGGLHGVRHMQFSRTGEVYWNGVYLKHLDVPVDPSHYDEVQELGLICSHLETIGVPVNSRTAVSHANWFSQMKIDEPYKAILSRCPKVHIGSDKLLLVFRRSVFEINGVNSKTHRLLENKASQFTDKDWLERQGYTTWPMTELEIDDLRICFSHYGVPSDLFPVMSDDLNPPWRR